MLSCSKQGGWWVAWWRADADSVFLSVFLHQSKDHRYESLHLLFRICMKCTSHMTQLQLMELRSQRYLLNLVENFIYPISPQPNPLNWLCRYHDAFSEKALFPVRAKSHKPFSPLGFQKCPCDKLSLGTFYLQHSALT